MSRNLTAVREILVIDQKSGKRWGERTLLLSSHSELCQCLVAFRFRFIELIARRLKIRKMSKQQCNRTIQYKMRNEMKKDYACLSVILLNMKLVTTAWVGVM